MVSKSRVTGCELQIKLMNRLQIKFGPGAMRRFLLELHPNCLLLEKWIHCSNGLFLVAAQESIPQTNSFGCRGRHEFPPFFVYLWPSKNQAFHFLSVIRLTQSPRCEPPPRSYGLWLIQGVHITQMKVRNPITWEDRWTVLSYLRFACSMPGKNSPKKVSPKGGL